jgi:hypothetical protein
VEIERLALTLVSQPTIHISGFGVSRSVHYTSALPRRGNVAV